MQRNSLPAARCRQQRRLDFTQFPFSVEEIRPIRPPERSFLGGRSVWRTLRNREEVAFSFGFCSMLIFATRLGRGVISTIGARDFASRLGSARLRADYTHICEESRILRRHREVRAENFWASRNNARCAVERYFRREKPMSGESAEGGPGSASRGESETRTPEDGVTEGCPNTPRGAL